MTAPGPSLDRLKRGTVAGEDHNINQGTLLKCLLRTYELPKRVDPEQTSNAEPPLEKPAQSTASSSCHLQSTFSQAGPWESLLLP